MSLMKWDPFRDLLNIQQSIGRLFDDRFLRLPEERGELPSAFMFPVDIQDKGDSLMVRAEIPGLKREDIKISFSDGRLSIQGERKKEAREENTRFLRVERSYGNFYRSFNIDVPVEQERITASYRDGILEVSLPKAEESKPKLIDIEISE
ncbi:MAG: Hsp20/alpha crystallin family protein [Peptococcaceae bacterium]|nr:MAG: Hsp20/alpha crystallin family protein [Peptococcaceae bacterium]